MTQVHCLSGFFCFLSLCFVSGFLSPFTLFLNFDMKKLDQLWIWIINIRRRFKIISVYLTSLFFPFHLIPSSLWQEDRAMVRSQVMKLLSGALKKMFSPQKKCQRLLLLYQSTSHRSLPSAVTTRSWQLLWQKTLTGSLNLHVFLYPYVWQVRGNGVCLWSEEASEMTKSDLFITLLYTYFLLSRCGTPCCVQGSLYGQRFLSVLAERCQRYLWLCGRMVWCFLQEGLPCGVGQGGRWKH